MIVIDNNGKHNFKLSHDKFCPLKKFARLAVYWYKNQEGYGQALINKQSSHFPPVQLNVFLPMSPMRATSASVVSSMDPFDEQHAPYKINSIPPANVDKTKIVSTHEVQAKRVFFHCCMLPCNIVLIMLDRLHFNFYISRTVR